MSEEKVIQTTRTKGVVLMSDANFNAELSKEKITIVLSRKAILSGGMLSISCKEFETDKHF